MDNATQIKRKAQELARKGAFDEAAAQYSQLAEQGKLEPYDLVVLGDLLNRSGNRQLAVGRYMEAMANYASAGLNRNAIALAKKVQRLAPAVSAVHRRLGEYYADEGLSSESCLHYLEYLEKIDRTAENAQEVQDVCVQLLELSLPSFDIVENIVNMAREAGQEKAMVQGVLRQADRAASMANLESETKLRGLARGLDPEAVQAAEAPPVPAEEPVLLDPGALHLDDPPVGGEPLSLDGFSLDEGESAEPVEPDPEPVAMAPQDAPSVPEKTFDLDAAMGLSGEESPGEPLTMKETAFPGPPSPDEGTEGEEHDGDLMRARGLEFQQSNEPARAQREFMKAAAAYFEAARSQDAAELYERVVRMDPNHLEALRGLVEIAYINGEKSKMAHWGCELGDVLLARERYAEAKVQFERVLAFDSDNPKARSRVRRLNTIAGVQEASFGELTPTPSEVEGAKVTIREDEAEGSQSAFDLSEILEEFRAAVVDRIPAEDGQSHYDLGVTYKEMGLLQEAAQEFELSASHEENRTGSLEMLGQCYLELDQIEDAIRVLELVLPLANTETRAITHLRLGNAREALGEWDRAEEQYYQALELKPDLEEATKNLQRLERRREQGAA